MSSASTLPMQMPFVTHWLNQMEQDKALIRYLPCRLHQFSATDKLKIIFVPCYLDGRDGILNKPYYDLLIGMDATVYPSYYEPWGYTPLESIAFGIPTIAHRSCWLSRVVYGAKARHR
ncbi:MAG: glycosyltransferase [Parabacteroides merdae]